MTTSKFQQELDRLHAFYQKELGKKDKTISGLHRILDGHDRQIERLENEREKRKASGSGGIQTMWKESRTIVELREALKSASDFMDYLRANTGVSDEWPIELKIAPDAAPHVNKLLNDFENKVYAITKPKPSPVS